MRTELQHGYILHARPFRDTSLIIDCLTRDWGRLSLLARGWRAGKSRQKPALQPFTPMLLSWQGKSDLKTLIHAETAGAHFPLQGLGLYAALYLNELLVRLLPVQDAHVVLTAVYEEALAALLPVTTVLAAEPVLRRFELNLLAHLGYGFDFSADAQGQPIRPDWLYHFVPEHGFSPALPHGRGLALPGAHLLAMAAQDWSERAVQRSAKALLRAVLQPLLGARPLLSRELFAGLARAGEPAGGRETPP